MVCTKLYICNPFGGLAQLARALAWHARGHRFESGILHKAVDSTTAFLFCIIALAVPKTFRKEATGSNPVFFVLV